jgi:hypothetical protein
VKRGNTPSPLPGTPPLCNLRGGTGILSFSERPGSETKCESKVVDMQTQRTEKKYEFGQSGQQRQTNRPVKAFRSGTVQVSIWENESLTDEGQVQSFKTVSFDRRYKDKSGEWKSSNSLRANDLPKATLLLNKAYEYLVLTGEDEAYV